MSEPEFRRRSDGSYVRREVTRAPARAAEPTPTGSPKPLLVVPMTQRSDPLLEAATKYGVREVGPTPSEEGETSPAAAFPGSRRGGGVYRSRAGAYVYAHSDSGACPAPRAAAALVASPR